MFERDCVLMSMYHSMSKFDMIMNEESYKKEEKIQKKMK